MNGADLYTPAQSGHHYNAFIGGLNEFASDFNSVAQATPLPTFHISQALSDTYGQGTASRNHGLPQPQG